jgi:threonine dehydrogenase-like Zn-dependent dehydrogenase
VGRELRAFAAVPYNGSRCNLRSCLGFAAIVGGGADLDLARRVDVAIEALGTQNTFESALRVLRPGGTLSSLGV